MSDKPVDTGVGAWRGDAARLMAAKPSGILFLCVANSARSQMAEGIARHLAPKGVRVFSAGSAPSRVHPLAVQALAEIGIDISGQYSKGIDAVRPEEVDAVITLCADEVCPVWLADAIRVHWGLPDPAEVQSDDALGGFRSVRDELMTRLRCLFQ